MNRWLWVLIAIAAVLVIAALVIVLLMWKYTDNTGLVVTEYQISNKKIPQGFRGFRIAQVADLHNTEFGENNSELLSLLEESKPDIIVFTGDQVDARETNPEVVLALARQAVQIAPCYLVTGNHEGSTPINSQLNEQLREIGVNVMENEVIDLQSGNDTITLIGAADPTMSGRFLEIGQEATMDEVLTDLCAQTEGYSVLLSHHPEFLEVYAKRGVDLVLSGHAHGGQIRIGEQGIIAPHQGLFPKYDAGQYTEGNTTLILSRGLGNSMFPWRVNNPPELVVVELTAG